MQDHRQTVALRQPQLLAVALPLALAHRGRAELRHEEVESDKVDNLRPFEGCMPIEVMAARGIDTLRYGPMKPVGLDNPHSATPEFPKGRWPYAVVQLRQDNKLGTLWNMVGFQTKLKHAEQVRLFRTIPGLENAEFARLGGLHRNTFLNSPRLLDGTLRLKAMPRLPRKLPPPTPWTRPSPSISTPAAEEASLVLPP